MVVIDHTLYEASRHNQCLLAGGRNPPEIQSPGAAPPAELRGEGGLTCRVDGFLCSPETTTVPSVGALSGGACARLARATCVSAAAWLPSRGRRPRLVCADVQAVACGRCATPRCLARCVCPVAPAEGLIYAVHLDAELRVTLGQTGDAGTADVLCSLSPVTTASSASRSLAAWPPWPCLSVWPRR